MNLTNSGNSHKRLIIIGLLMVYIALSFWGGSRYPALNDKATMGSETRLEDSLSFEVLLEIQEGDSVAKRITYSTVNWVNTNKQGMTFGVLFAGAFLTFLNMLRRRSFKGSYANALMGFVIGAPLGVCVNCAAPIAKGLHEAGARLETTLTTMFSSPTMNIVVLTMVFTIFPFYLAMIKLASTLIFILLLIPLMSRYLFHKETLATHEPLNCTVDTTIDVSLEESWPQALLVTGREYLKNLWFIIIRTVPLMFLAGLLGAVFVTLFPLNSFIGSEYTLPGLLLVSLIGVFLPVPIALDVVLASVLMASGLLEIYLDQIAAGASAKAARRLSRGLTYYCDDIKNEKQQKDCKKNIEIRKFFRSGSKHQPSDIKYCKTIASPDEQKACMAMTVMKTAVQSNKPEICKHIPNKQSRAYILCDNYFKKSVKTTEAEYQRAIPQRLNQNVLLLPDGEGKFVDKAEQYHLDIAGWAWNAKFSDLDNDEWLDLYVVNSTIRRALTNTNIFFRNLQGKDFEDRTMEFGLDGFMAVSSYTYLDIDNDGDLDIVTTSINGPLWLYKNNSDKNSIIFKLQDHKGNRFGIGSKLVIHYGPDNKYHQIRELKAGGGFISFDAPSLHFGLGKHDQVNKIEIFWSTGEHQVINQSFKAGRSYLLERL